MFFFLRDFGINVIIKWYLSFVWCNNIGYDFKCLIYVFLEYFIVWKMNCFLKMLVIGVLKLGNLCFGKGCKVYMLNVIKIKII